MTQKSALITGWMSHRKVLLEIVGKLEDQHVSYKPWEGAMSLSELVLHMTSAMGMFAQTVKNGTFTPPAAQPEVKTINELKETIQKETEETKSQLESLTDDQLAQIVEFAGMQMPGIALLESGKDHEIHHKGQLFTYARLVGVEELPFFINRS